MQPILLTIVLIILFIVLVLSMIELFKPLNRKGRKNIDKMVHEARTQRDLMKDGFYIKHL